MSCFIVSTNQFNGFSIIMSCDDLVWDNYECMENYEGQFNHYVKEILVNDKDLLDFFATDWIPCDADYDLYVISASCRLATE